MTEQNCNLTERELKILTQITEAYILIGEPVGSRWLSKVEGIDLSPATLRNIMTDLTERALLEQPHTSAGRVPTDKGYRIYVDRLFSSQDNEKRYPGLMPLTSFLPQQADRLENIFHSTTRYLASMTNLLGLLTTPCPLESSLKKIDFILLSENRVIMLLITQSGMVLHKNIYIREAVDAEILSITGEYLNKQFYNCLLRDIREHVLNHVNAISEGNESQKAVITRMCKKAFNLDEFGQLISHGMHNFYGMGADIDKEQMMDTLDFIDNKSTLIEVMERQSRDGVVKIMIGHENDVDQLNQFSVVSTSYGNGQKMLGTIGVIGPKRMNYDRVTYIIQNAANQLSDEIKGIMQR